MEKILNQLLEGQKEIIKRLDKVEAGQQEQKKEVKEIKLQQKENCEILHAVREAQEIQKAELDRLNITTAHIEGGQERIAGDVTFLVRKAAEHEDDIRELKRVK